MGLHALLSLLYQPVNPLDRFENLLSYIQPELNEDGSCPIFKVPGERYDLSLLAQTPEQLPQLRDLLIRLNRLAQYVHQQTGVEWFGVYLHHDGKLVKYAYIGSMSKAEFPITEQHRETSVNTRVFMDREAIHIADVTNHSGPYYRCDADVKSEFCCPLLDANGEAFGIFDCEAHSTHFFDDKLTFFAATLKQALEIFLANHPFLKLA